jgi:hypothetical protein
LTPDTIASVAATVGIGVISGVTVGALDAGALDAGALDAGALDAGALGAEALDAGGLTDGLGTTVGIAVPTAVDRGVALGEAGDAVTTGVALGAADGGLLEDGVAVGPLVGRAMTRTVSSPAALVPTTTAWLRTGDFEIDFGRTCMSTAWESPPLTGAQSGWRSAGQTSLTFATL